MTVYKFLAPARRHRFRDVEMPPPGVWIDAADESSDGPEGVRAYADTDLAHWIDAELWEVELAGEVTALACSVLAPRGRLVRRVEAWTPELAHELALASVWRARDVLADDLAAAGHEATAGALRAPMDPDALLAAAVAAAADAPDGWADRVGLVVDACEDAVSEPVATVIATATVAVVGWDEAGHRAERAWQSAWIADRLGLAGT